MSEVIGYRNIFDREFYSCEVGLAKPDHQYFTFILREIGLRAEEVLFLDDILGNVTAAAKVGIQSVQFDCFREEPWDSQLRQILRRVGVLTRQG